MLQKDAINETEYKSTVERLREVDAVIKDLDPTIREAAFAILKPYVTGRSAGQADVREGNGGGDSAPPLEEDPPRPAPAEDEDLLIERHISDSDSDNALLALAIFYKRHGRGPFELDNIRAITGRYNLNIPKRVDKFLKGAKRGEPKANVVRQQDGWKIMPSGEGWLKETYNVAMGRDPLPTASAAE